jgi:hypothetical protein
MQKLLVKDRDGRILSKVDLNENMTNSQIMDAAKILNQGPKKVVVH